MLKTNSFFDLIGLVDFSGTKTARTTPMKHTPCKNKQRQAGKGILKKTAQIR